MLQNGLNYAYHNLNALPTSDMLLLCDHARNALPTPYDFGDYADLGISHADMHRHMAYDIGIESVTRHTAELLNAPMVHSLYSRLFVDCNRQLDIAVVENSDDITIPANQGLTQNQINDRLKYHQNYHTGVDALIKNSKPNAWIISMHSFTDYMQSTGDKRPWEIAIIYGRDDELSQTLIRILQEQTDFTIGDNQPYNGYNSTTYTMRTHADGNQRRSTLIEFRQDLITTDSDCQEMAKIITPALKQLYAELG